ncbi:hypothetical protein Poli38472_008758 [Pythium oligandrum]|uniref:UBL3-like ubiquitin domain-containing protein n=1 Tax=Pythium oligandrum TaxID=41045 RepID=A0A8K1C460_PYTOL|nr:hypothetical protein Poli38472_008758 [Pythium oligandrum]|eukprot:TMW56110.1 hypothetical protein Poli38472_008758 [Pythium oligandrum]
MSRQGAGSSENELALKFLFANQDNVKLVLRFPKSTLVSQVKTALRENWPEGLPTQEEVKTIRLICMGRGMLQDNQTLEGNKVPAFPTHPTPVNVSILRNPTPSAASEKPVVVANKSTPGQLPPNAPTPSCGCVIL